jgi:hypothetical protein
MDSLRSSKSGAPTLEAAYARHYVLAQPMYDSVSSSRGSDRETFGQ